MNYLEHLLAGRTDFPCPTTRPEGSRVEAPGEGLVVIEPAQSAFDVLISAGIHGNETAPIELAAQLLQEVLSGALPLRARLMFVFGNPAAIRQGVRYLDEDLNRLFGKPASQTGDGPTAQRARALEAAACAFFAASGPRAKLHYDLHTAIRGSAIEQFAIYPFPHEAGFDEVEIARLGACGISAVLLQSAPSPTFSYFTRRHCGAHGFTLELGKARPFGQNAEVNLDRLAAELRQLISGTWHDHRHTAIAPQRFVVSREVVKTSETFRLHLDDAVENFTPLPQGFVLAEDGAQRFIVEEVDARIVFPNPKVKPGLRAGLIVVPA